MPFPIVSIPFVSGLAERLSQRGSRIVLRRFGTSELVAFAIVSI